MRFLALPLRILLAVALVLNGIGGAAAAVAALELAADSGIHAAADPPDCGAHADAGDAAGHAGAAASTHPCPSSGDEACDEDLQCLQACTHAGLALAPRVVVGVQVNGAGPLHRIGFGYASPPARSPIRPPIA